MNKLAIITTHPIQYYAPLFTHLAKKTDLKVFYTWGTAATEKYDPGFGRVIEWDIPLLEGYDYRWVNNTSKKPGSHHFKGIVNPTLISELEAFNPAAILVIGYAYQSHLLVMRHFNGKLPIWFRGDSNLLDPIPAWKSLVKIFYLKWVYHYVDQAFYVGSANKSYFKNYGLKEKQLVFAPHAIDNDRFAIDRKAEALDLRKSLEITEQEILILFAGKLEPKKNPKLLLKAFIEIMEERNPKKNEKSIARSQEDLQIHLLFVGNGVLEESLKLKVKSLKLKNVHFIDFQNQRQMPVVYQACDIFCLPSKGPGETWGLTVNEAMACGKAVLVSDQVGCAQDLIIHGKNGFVFKNNDLEDFKTCLTTLIHSEKLEQMGAESLKIIKNWTFEAQVKVIATLIKKSIGQL